MPRDTRCTTLILCASLLLAPSIGWNSTGGHATLVAQDRHVATVLLRNGNRLSGEFEDIQNDLLYLRISRDDERRIPLRRVVVIDFAGSAENLPAAERRGASSDQHVMVLRNATIWRGRLEDVRRAGEGGARTIANARIDATFRRNNGRTERVRIRRVRRIYLGAVR